MNIVIDRMKMEFYNQSLLKVIFVIILFVIFVGCQTKTSDNMVIDVAGKIGTGSILQLSDYADEIRYVKLETTNKILLGNILRFMYEHEIMIVGDVYNYVRIFDKNGFFLHQAGRIGQGPEEYTICNGFDYLSGMDKMFLQVHGSLYHYDLNGNFVGKSNLYPEKGRLRVIHKVLYLTPDIYVADIVSYKTSTSRFLILNDSMQVIKDFPGFYPFKKGDSEIYTPGVENGIMYRNQDKIIFYKPYEDTVFAINKNLETEVYLTFNYGKYKYSEDRSRKCVLLLNMQEASKFLFLEFKGYGGIVEPFKYYNPWGRETRSFSLYGIVNKETGELVFMNRPKKEKLGFENDIHIGLPPFWPKFITSKGELVDYYSADEFIRAFRGKENLSENIKNILSNLKEDDNPVIAIAKLK